jgi:hypothetical protein
MLMWLPVDIADNSSVDMIAEGSMRACAEILQARLAPEKITPSRKRS